MGGSFYQCDNCEECHCDFGQCFVCDADAICLDCIETQKKRNTIYNVIYCKAEDDEFGNLDYVYICDRCLLRTDEEHKRYHTTEEGLKYIKSVKKN